MWLQCADRQEEVAGSQTSARGWGALLIFGGGLTPYAASVLTSGCCPGPGGEGSRKESWGSGRVVSAAAACDSTAPLPTRPLTGLSWGPREMPERLPSGACPVLLLAVCQLSGDGQVMVCSLEPAWCARIPVGPGLC